MKDLHFETLTRISELIRSRAISSVEVTERCSIASRNSTASIAAIRQCSRTAR